MRLIDDSGQQVGIVSLDEAKTAAQSKSLDLVEIAADSKPPVVKILDYAKFKYEQAARKKAARRNQTSTSLKEVRFRLKIDQHDYDTKVNQVKRFLNAGDKVKVGIMFRGREQQKPQFGYDLLTKIADELKEFAQIENAPSLEGRNLSLVLASIAKKNETISNPRQAQLDHKEHRLARQKHRLDAKQTQEE